jgi:tRNA(Arg) A34 adenosine deaminase TadA
MHELDHEGFMRRAIELTANAPERPFGAVIVDLRSGEILAEGWNKSATNPTWHGEIVALDDLFRSGRRVDGRELVLYTTAEPCPMCMGAILWSGIESVVFGTTIQFLVDIGWKQLQIPAREVVERSPEWQCKVIGGVLGSECNELFLTVSRAAPGR